MMALILSGMTLPSKGYVGVALLVNDKIVDFSKGAICWYDAETGNWLENDGIAQNIHQEPLLKTCTGLVKNI